MEYFYEEYKSFNWTFKICIPSFIKNIEYLIKLVYGIIKNVIESLEFIISFWLSKLWNKKSACTEFLIIFSFKLLFIKMQLKGYGDVLSYGPHFILFIKNKPIF